MPIGFNVSVIVSGKLYIICLIIYFAFGCHKKLKLDAKLNETQE